MEDEEEEEDSADALIRQLLEYRLFKEVAGQLRTREEEGLRAYVRLAPRPELERRLDLSDVDMDKLQRALRRALARIPSDPPMPSVKTYPITVAEQIDNVRSYIFSAQRRQQGAGEGVSFTELLSRNQTRVEVIVTFLAVLELIKQRELLAEQTNTFGEIMLQAAPRTAKRKWRIRWTNPSKISPMPRQSQNRADVVGDLPQRRRRSRRYEPPKTPAPPKLNPPKKSSIAGEPLVAVATFSCVAPKPPTGVTVGSGVHVAVGVNVGEGVAVGVGEGVAVGEASVTAFPLGLALQ